MKKKTLSLLTAAVLTAGQLIPAVSAQAAETANTAASYRMEALDRGLAVVRNGDSMYLSWRLLGTEDYNTSFIVYRDGIEIAEVTNSTNYVDKGGTMASVYTVAPANNPSDVSEPVCAWASGENYIDILFDLPAGGKLSAQKGSASADYTYQSNDVSVGDLDGDGQYELVVKFMPSNNGESTSKSYTGNVLLGAYELDGTPVWTDSGSTAYINLGVNVRANPHGTQFLVYDFNGDGKAEISTKTAQGTMDTSGQMLLESDTELDYYTTVPSSNYSDNELNDPSLAGSSLSHAGSNGQVLCGREYYTVFDGDGKFIDSVAYHGPRTYSHYNEYSESCKTELSYLWGDNFGNRSERYIATVSYLDGSGEPFMVEWRGYYHGRDNGLGRTAVGAYSLKGDELTLAYCFDTAAPVFEQLNDKELEWNDVFGSKDNAIKQLKTNNPDFVYSGNGNHNITTADVDDDGRDEILSGSLCLQVDENNELRPKWNYGKGHGDALHIGKYIKGKHMQYFIVHEGSPYGMSLIDPYYDGEENEYGTFAPEVLFHEDGGGDTGRGLMLKGDADGFIIDSVSNDARKVTYADGNYSFSGSIGYISDKVEESDTALDPDDETNPDASPEPTSSPTTNAFNYRTGGGGRYSLNFRIFWDGDLYEELFDAQGESYDPFISKYDPEGQYAPRIFYFTGTRTNNSSKCNPSLTADIIGDWREEVICRLADNSGLRLYMSSIYTNNKLYTLMHDPTYRCGVAAEQSAYNQPPHVGYYVGEDMEEYQRQKITTPALTETDAHRYNWSKPSVGEATSTAGFIFKDNLLENAEKQNVTLNNGTVTFDQADSSYVGYNLSKAIDENVTVSFDITPGENFKAGFQLRDSSNHGDLSGDGWSKMVANFSFSDGDFINNYSSQASGELICSLPSGATYNIRIYVDWVTRKFSVEVLNSDTGALLASYSKNIRNNDADNPNAYATNFKRLTFYNDDATVTNGNSFTLDNLLIYTGELPSVAVLTPDKAATGTLNSTTITAASAAAGDSVTYTPSFFNSKGTQLTDYSTTLEYTVTTADGVPAEGFTASGNTLSISQNVTPGDYIVRATDGITTAVSMLEVTAPRELTAEDMALEVNYALANISGDTQIYTSVDDMNSGKNGQTAAELGITEDTKIITVSAGLGIGIDKDVYKIESVDLTINSETVNETVTPHIFDKSLMLAQFFGEGFDVGNYDVTADVNYSINGEAATNTVTLNGGVTINEEPAEKQLTEYYYRSNGVNVSLMVLK